MAWSVIKSISKWKYLIKKMIEDSKKYIIFDQRVANVNFVSFDEKILYANYGGKTGPLLCINYKLLKEFLLQQKNDLKKIELMAYESRWGKNVKFNSKKNTFVTTVVLHKKIKRVMSLKVFMSNFTEYGKINMVKKKDKIFASEKNES